MTGSERERQAADPPRTTQPATEKPAPSEEARAKATEMAKAYEERPTAVLPGSNRTVTGTAVNAWLDDEGNPIYGDDNKSRPGERT